MPKIKIFTAKNVQRYGFTDGEIDELNAEWERKASGLGLEEHLPEYWQQAKRHMSEKLEGRVAESREESENKQLDGEPIELPSLEVNLDDFDIAGENEITAVDLSDEETEVEFLSDELSELESIPVDDLELEVIPEGQTVSIEEMTGEEKPAEKFATAEEPELQDEEAIQELTIPVEEKAEEDKSVEVFAAVVEPEIEVEEAVQEQTIAAEEMEEEIAAEEKIVSAEEPELESADTVRIPETAMEEPVRESVAEEDLAPVEEEKKESFFAKIIARLKKIF